jgi:hypothetical protein
LILLARLFYFALQKSRANKLQRLNLMCNTPPIRTVATLSTIEKVTYILYKEDGLLKEIKESKKTLLQNSIL